MSAPLWGCPWHGLMDALPLTVRVGTASYSLPSGYGAWLASDFSYPWTDYGDTHLVKVPGIAELDIDPDDRAAQHALGRAWQNYALLTGAAPLLHGVAVNGWHYIDSTGRPWIVRQASGPSLTRYGNIDQTGALNVVLHLRPYGMRGPTADPVIVSATLADIGQANPDGVTVERGSTLHLRLTALSSDGHDAIIAVYPSPISAIWNYDPRDLPYGWLRLRMADDAGVFTAQLEVLYTRTEALGTRSDVVPPGVSTDRLELLLDGECTVTRDALGAVVSVDGSWAYAGTRLKPTTDFPFHGSSRNPGGAFSFFEPYSGRVQRSETIGRVVGVAFDADELVTITADTVSEEVQSRGYSVEGAGAFSVSGLSATVSGSVTLTITHTDAATNSVGLVLRRNGAPIDEYRFERSWDATRTNTVVLGSSASNQASDDERFGVFSVVYDYGAGTARDFSGIGRASEWIPAAEYAWTNTLRRNGVAVEQRSGEGDPFWGAAPLGSERARIGFSAQLGNGEMYLRIDIALQRLCNQLWLPRLERYTSAAAALPVAAESHAVITPNGAVDERVTAHAIDRRYITGSYEPVTRDVYVGYQNRPTALRWKMWI